MVAVLIAPGGVITSTELGERVPAFTEGTRRYVTLTDSLGSACSKGGLGMSTTGSRRVGRAYFHAAYQIARRSHAARVSQIEWIDAESRDTVGNTFKDMLVKRDMPWCLVLDPEQVTPDYAVVDLELTRYDILERRAFMDYVKSSGKHAHYIEQIEGLLVLYRRIAAADRTDSLLSGWGAVREALEPLLCYYEGHGSAAPKFLIIQNPENPDNPDGEETSRYMAASRLEPDAPPMDTCEESIRRFFDAFCQAIMRYENGRSLWYTTPASLPEKEYEDLIYKVYDVPKRARGQHTGFEARADPRGLREFFQKQDPAFNDAMFTAALYMRTDPTASILYYEHYLTLLRRVQPSAIAPAGATAGMCGRSAGKSNLQRGVQVYTWRWELSLG